ncbi:MAG: response regulator transcription factor [Bryobacteraceae bacterium]|nr:response regulator transcription factor [Bryobacteraceae bacterium]
MVVEDHGIMREGLTLIINSESDMVVAAEAVDGGQAVERFHRCRPDVTLMDLRLPTVQGVEAIRQIRLTSPAARIIVLTTYEGDEDVYSALQAGAQAYLLKGMSREDLVETIRAVYAGHKRIPAAIATRLAEHMDHVELSARELEVLRLIASGQSNKEVAFSLKITEFTVKFHVKAILSKFGVRDRTQAVTTAIQRGIIHLQS